MDPPCPRTHPPPSPLRPSPHWPHCLYFLHLSHPQATQEVVAHVPVATDEELHAAVAAAKRAFPAWRDTPVQQRMRYILRFQQLIRDNQGAPPPPPPNPQDELVAAIVLENGKTKSDAEGDIFRGLGPNPPPPTTPPLIPPPQRSSSTPRACRR
jgi:hypothetical protein